MSATFRILEHRVGAGGLKHGRDVLRIEQLLQLNGYKIKADGNWNSGTTDAFIKFQEKNRNPMEAYNGIDSGPLKRWIDPNDRILFDLAYGAGVLIRLAAGGNIYRHGIGFEDVHEWCERQKIPFDMRRRAVWGLDGYPTWAIVTEFNESFGAAAFDTQVPRALNCTLYANLMMSVWKQGNAHGRPFNASVKDAGGDKHFAKDRYHYPLLGEFSSVADIQALTRKHPGGLFCLEYGKDRVGHLGLLYKGRVHECNYGPTRDVHAISLSQWVSTHGWGWVLGPAPA